VRLRYGDSAGKLNTLALTPVVNGGNVLFTGTVPASDSDKPLIYGLEAEDATGRVAATPYRVLTIGLTRRHSVALVGGRDFAGTWSPASIWGAWGRVSTAGSAEDTHLFLTRPGSYHVWLLAQPRTRGIEVNISESSLEGKPQVKLAEAVPAGSEDGWYQLGTFDADESQLLHVTVRPVGNAGYCAYGEVVLTQDTGFAPPLRYAGIDWFNSITLRGLTPGQEVTGKIAVTVQATGNLDTLTVAAHLVRGPIGNVDDKRFAERNGGYELDSRTLPPGEYDIVATGWRIVDEKTGRTYNALISASVRVVVPGNNP